MRADEIVVEVRDRNFQRVGVILAADIDMQITGLHNNIGAWSLTLPTEHPLADALRTPGAGIIITGPFGVFSGPLIKPEKQVTPEDSLGSITFEGVTDDVILADYLAWPEPSNADVTTQALAHDVRTGPAETVIHEYVSNNIGPDAPAGRAIPGLGMSADQGRGETVTKSARFDVLGTMLADLAAPSNLGFRVYQQGDGRLFETYEVRDLSRQVRLSLDNGQLVGQRSSIGAPGVTRVIVAGQGQLVDRTFRYYDNPASLEAEAEWGRRIERFLDQRQTDDEDEHDQAAAELLAESGFTSVALQVVPTEGTTMDFGSDWFLGDKVSALVDGIEVPVVVTGFTMKYDQDGFAIGIILGDMELAKSMGVGAPSFGAPSSAAPSTSLTSASSKASSLERHTEVPTDTGWLTPTLLNSWAYYGTYAEPRYRRIGKEVVLKGLVDSGTFGDEIFVLPADCRPAELLHLHGHVETRTGGSRDSIIVQVLPTGEVIPDGTVGGSGFVALDGIRFLID